MPAPAPVVLVFPPDTKGGVTDALTDVITDVEQSRLSIVGNYHPIYFLRSLPTIQRSVSEQSLNSSDVRPPFDNNAKVTRLAKLLGYPMLIVGAIEDYQYDASKKTVTLLLSARMLDVSEAKPRIIRSVTLPGSGAATAKETSEESTAVRVARDTAEKLMTDLLKPTKPSTTAPAAGAAK